MMRVSLLVIMLFGLASAADDRQPGAKPFDDANFVAEAGSGGLFEVELGKLALAQAMREDVKRFAQKMIDDHTKANDDLKAAATSAGRKVPEKMNAKDQKQYERFQGLKGGAFDSAYIQHMVKDHEMDVDAFTKASKQAGAMAIRDFAANTLPVIQSHLDLIRKISEAGK